VRNVLLKKSSRFVMGAILASLLLSGCASKNELLLFHGLDQNNTKVDDSMVLSEERVFSQQKPYVIKRFDRVAVKVYGAYENNTNNEQTGDNSVQVDENGYAILPIIGRVKLAGLTESEASKKVQKLMRKSIVDVIASVEVPNKVVYVIGDVNKPGPIKLSSGQTPLLSAISAAGGFKDSGSKEAVYLVTKDGSDAKLTKLSLSSPSSLANSFRMLNPGDIVYIAPNSAKMVKMSKLETLQMIGTALQPVATAAVIAK